jgi:NADH-quinone oxidoreductase subunit M
VVTAVYILRASGKVIMGPINEDHVTLPDATWYEKSAAILLITSILVIGMSPFMINQIIQPSVDQLMTQIQTLTNLK